MTKSRKMCLFARVNRSFNVVRIDGEERDREQVYYYDTPSVNSLEKGDASCF